MDDAYAGLIHREPMTARFRSRCQISPDHMIEPGQFMALVYAEGEPEPLGYGCAVCLAEISESRRNEMRRQ